jgi:sulfate transport system permease protein
MPVTNTKKLLPGFNLTLGLTITYLSLLVLIPFSALFLKASDLGWTGIWNLITEPRVLAAFKLSFAASLGSASIDAVFGLVIAWVLVRYEFPGRSLFDALVDMPFALPTAVAGITLTTLFVPDGIIGRIAAVFGIKVAFTPLGIVLALTFVGLPFGIRTLQPVIQSLEADFEEAAACLGASRRQTLTRVVFPALLPAWLTGFSLAFARAVGEYGSIAFVSGNMPMRTEIAPLLIMSKLEQYDYSGATAIAVVMLTVSFLMLLTVNFLQSRGRKGRS